VDREQVLFRLFGKYCPGGTILATEGSPGQELYVIQSGAVRLGAARPEGGGAGLLGPGDLFGEGSFFTPAPRSTRAEVVQDARLILVNDRTLEAVVRHGPQTAHMIFDKLLALTTSAGSELALWTVGQLLRRIAPNLTEAAAGGGIVAADLAEAAGLVEADVLLVLEELRRRGCLIREGSRYRAPDAAALRREIEGIATGGERA
jgi:CRP-like cAMP-binding protein